ncbi:protein-tyrosine phosphatase-like protein [Gilbertella persicaria]|uniref:protein-tyrosine phosphatase-like protein n=1 Tax=Gilbertella persicaria TaxID=101096 RepID=UPI00221EDCD7|nr:protein-tyrosine phosphatase-like protein [Gilbertella persicaria]KAI8077331.1 protein-tyrosine phosphatase-like protein [Gilbertella persicaria]
MISSPLGRMLSLIPVPSSSLQFLILDCPTESTLGFYLDEFKKHNVTHVVRCCQPTYSITQLNEQGIQVHDLPFKDGGVPPPHVVHEWLSIIQLETDTPQTIAVHCVAGLGRAPALVAIGLIELSSMQPLDAVEYIRRKRRGAFNKPQIAYLDIYKPILRKKKLNQPSLKTSFSRIIFRLGGFSSKSKDQPAEELTSIPLSSCV